jgi:hypothetical protein
MSNSSILILHGRAINATYEEVKEVVTPECTKYWQPISHIELIDTIKEEAEKNKLIFKREQYGMTKKGERLFGTIEFEADNSEYNFAIGIRNSHNKEWSAGICSGLRVLVCDNMAFSGSYVCNRKHTPTKMNEIKSDIKRALLEMPMKLSDLLAHVDGLKKDEITLDEAKVILFDSCYSVGAIPLQSIRPIWDEYNAPSYEVFPPGTKHSLLMAYTEHFKRQKQILSLEKQYRLIAPVFGLDRF